MKLSHSFTAQLLYWTCLFLLTSCASRPTVTTGTPIVASALPTTEISPVVTETPATIPIPPYDFEEKCTYSSTQPLPELSGYLVLNVFNDYRDYQTTLLDLESYKLTSIGRTDSDTYYDAVSPNGRLLAHWDKDLMAYVVLDIASQIHLTIPDPDRRVLLDGWRDDESILFFKRLNEFQTGGFIRGALISVNINTKEQSYWLSDDFPHLDPSWYVNWELSVDPDLTKMVYPYGENDSMIVSTVLWDLPSKSVLAKVYNANLEYMPRWSPLGDRFIVSALPTYTSEEGNVYTNGDETLPYIGGDELYLVTESGDINRLTFFSTFAKPNINDYWWSPDGSKVAFYLRWDDYSSLHSGLAVIDVDSGKTTMYCEYGWPVWSPDGKYIVFSSSDYPADRATLLDLETSETWVISTNATVVGWMAAEP